MIEKKEDHMKDEVKSEQPHTASKMVKPYWPQPDRPLRVTFEVENLSGARIDVNLHISEKEPCPPTYYRMGEKAEEQEPEEVATDE